MDFIMNGFMATIKQHLFHGSLDHEPLWAWQGARRDTPLKGLSPPSKATMPTLMVKGLSRHKRSYGQNLCQTYCNSKFARLIATLFLAGVAITLAIK